jgi:hypothetical protein
VVKSRLHVMPNGFVYVNIGHIFSPHLRLGVSSGSEGTGRTTIHVGYHGFHHFKLLDPHKHVNFSLTKL